MMKRLTLAPLSLALALLASGSTAAQEIRGRIVEERSRQGINGVAVTAFAPDGTVLTRAETNRDGFFVLKIGAPGSYAIDVQSIGYESDSRTVELGEEDITVPAFVLQSQTIELDSVDVEVDRNTDPTAVGFARSTHIAAGARLATLEQHGVSFTSAMRELGGGLRVHEYLGPGGRPVVCIESTRRMPSISRGESRTCDWVAFVIDGVLIGTPESELRSYHLDQFESIEYYTPVEAGTRFGLRASAVGAVVLWTRGHGPHVSRERDGGG